MLILPYSFYVKDEKRDILHFILRPMADKYIRRGTLVSECGGQNRFSISCRFFQIIWRYCNVFFNLLFMFRPIKRIVLNC
jgi:hypothetical protein